MKIPKYKCGKVTPMKGDLVKHLGKEVLVTEVRLDPRSGLCNCIFGKDVTGYCMVLDMPWEVEFINRGKLPQEEK